MAESVAKIAMACVGLGGVICLALAFWFASRPLDGTNAHMKRVLREDK